MEDLVIKLIEEYQIKAKNTHSDKEREVLNSVINDLGRLLYSYRPSATVKLLNKLEENGMSFVHGAKREEEEEKKPSS